MNDTPHILFNRKDQEAPEEMVKQLPDCPVCGAKAYLRGYAPDGFGGGWSIGCPRYCLFDGIHGHDFDTPREEHLAEHGFATKEEAVAWWKKRVELEKKDGGTMTRNDITTMLSNLLVQQRLSGLGKYYASEVTLDYGSSHEKRVDFMQFCPANTVSVSGIEKGEFICYEVKSCLADYKSGHGQNFIGEKNYLVMPMELYKKICNELSCHIGVIVPIPKDSNKHSEFERPTELDDSKQWELAIIKNSVRKDREHYSVAELLFCMLRSGK